MPFSRKTRVATSSTRERLAAASALLIRIRPPQAVSERQLDNDDDHHYQNDDGYHHYGNRSRSVAQAQSVQAWRKAMLSSLFAPWMARRNIHYGWLIVSITFVTMLVTAGAMGLPGALIQPLGRE